MDTIKINSLEDLAKFATKNLAASEARYKLREINSQEFVDPIAGEAWQKERLQIKVAERPADMSWSDWEKDADHKRYSDEYEAWRSRRPEEKMITSFELERTGDRFYSRRGAIEISNELGIQIKKIWTMREDYRGSKHMSMTGSLSIIGILKRLGQTDIGKDVKAAQKKVKEENEKNSRNYDRRRLIEAAQKVLSLSDNKTFAGIDIKSMTIEMIINQIVEEK